MSTLFFTGFPGFLGSELLPRVLARAPDAEAVCLVQPRFLPLARTRAAALEADRGLRGRIRLVPGDITASDLGLGDALELRRGVKEIFHLAAVYDLGVEQDLATRVNVEGTGHMLRFARACPALERFHYMSTCFVSGRHPGVFSEADLDVGQRFNNHYEQTKYLAEASVRREMDAGLPASVYRPSVVVGDSVSGETQKFDGPYYVIQWVLRQGRVAVLPVVGDPTRALVNVVPRDFVVDAVAHLSGDPAAAGGVFHLADPEPLTVDQMLGVLQRLLHTRIVRVPVPLAVAKGAVEHLPGVRRWMRIPPASIDYFAHPTRYATAATQAALEGSGIRVPPFAEYAPKLIEFMRAHPSIGAEAMA